MIVGGSPRWELFRAVPAFPDAPDAAATTAAIAAPAARPVAPVAALPPAVVSQPSTATAAASSVSSILAAALGNGGPERSYGSSMEVVSVRECAVGRTNKYKSYNNYDII